jgi:4-amino-4-deoxy-L-arabinose transferase-like glycosyltransferase
VHSPPLEIAPPHDRGPRARLTAVEGGLVVALFLAGCVLRAAWPSALAVEHFDEGVYASNVFFSGAMRDERYPDQHLYAPPLLPLLIEGTMVVLGPSNVAAMVPGIVAGSLTIPLVWWVGRRWSGPVAGLASASLVALNDVHIFFSRTALTDVVLCFWLVAAVYLFWEAQVTRSRLLLIAAGAVTGLSWWTKYNGWLPLAIGVAGVIPWRVLDAWWATRAGQAQPWNALSNWQPLGASVLKWAVVAAIAFLVWSPWLWSLQDKGGYAAVMNNHRGYVVGLSGWVPSLCSQAARLRCLDGPFSTCEVPVAVAVCAVYLKVMASRFTWNPLGSNRTLLFGLATAWLVWASLGSAIAGVLLAGGGLLILGMSRRADGDAGETGSPSGLAVWLVTAWYLGLLATTPLYTPYPRLALPLLMACWLCGGLLLGAVCDRFCFFASAGDLDPARPDQRRPSEPSAIVAPAGLRATGRLVFQLAVLLLAAAMGKVRGIPAWQPRTGVADAVPAIIDDACRSVGVSRESGLDKFAISTYADPGLLFQLRLAGVGLVTPLTNLKFALPEAPPPPLPRFVLIGPAARRTAGFEEQLSAAGPRLELVQTYRITPSDLVLLDDGPRPAQRPVQELDLYRLK